MNRIAQQYHHRLIVSECDQKLSFPSPTAVCRGKHTIFLRTGAKQVAVYLFLPYGGVRQRGHDSGRVPSSLVSEARVAAGELMVSLSRGDKLFCSVLHINVAKVQFTTY